MSLASWAETTAQLPIYFSMVREDPLLDCEVVRSLDQGAEVLLVASGGCTAALLATEPNVDKLHLVDPNPAQLALARLKLQLLHEDSPSRKALLGHLPMLTEDRSASLLAILKPLGLESDCLGPLELVAKWGPDFSGRYERLFVRLRETFDKQIEALDALLRLSDLGEQKRLVSPETTLGRAMDEALDEVMDLPILVTLFGEGATRNRVEPFARHFARRARHALSTMSASSNPWLWLMLASRLPESESLPWLEVKSPATLPTLSFSNGFMADVLAEHSGEFDFVHLSNILDWLSPKEAERTLALAFQALRPGGMVFIRQLNSSLDIRDLPSGFVWDEMADVMHKRDRSFFYRALHLGRRP